MVWPLQDAKQNFSELVRRAESEGPQIVTRHGREVVVVVSVEQFHRDEPPPMDFVEFLMSAPHVELDLPERDRTGPRDIEW